MNLFKTFSKNIQLPSFMKIRPLGAELFHANGRTDRRTGRETDRRIDRQTGRHEEVNKHREIDLRSVSLWTYWSKSKWLKTGFLWT